MNYDKLIILLDKYFNGETSLKEEKELKIFFLDSGDLPKELLPLKNQYLAYAQLSSIKLDNTFDEKIIQYIENNSLSRESVPTLKKQPVKKHHISYIITSIAASILILFSIWMSIDHFKNKNRTNELGNPELAYQQTADLLGLLAVNFDKGLSKTQQIAKPLNKSLYALSNIKKVGKGVNALQPVAKLSKMEIIKNNK